MSGILLDAFHLLVPLLLAALALLIGGMGHDTIRPSDDSRDRIAFCVVVLLISASWLASGALAGAFIIRAIH